MGGKITPLLLNSTDASAMLSMSRSFFYQCVSEGRIVAPIKIGGKKSLWAVKSLEDFVTAELSKNKAK